jgi:hypothetical protein
MVKYFVIHCVLIFIAVAGAVLHFARPRSVESLATTGVTSLDGPHGTPPANSRTPDSFPADIDTTPAQSGSHPLPRFPEPAMAASKSATPEAGGEPATGEQSDSVQDARTADALTAAIEMPSHAQSGPPSRPESLEPAGATSQRAAPEPRAEATGGVRGVVQEAPTSESLTAVIASSSAQSPSLPPPQDPAMAIFESATPKGDLPITTLGRSGSIRPPQGTEPTQARRKRRSPESAKPKSNPITALRRSGSIQTPRATERAQLHPKRRSPAQSRADGREAKNRAAAPISAAAIMGGPTQIGSQHRRTAPARAEGAPPVLGLPRALVPSHAGQ